MIKSNKNQLALMFASETTNRLINELYNAGLNVYKIANVLNISSTLVKQALPKNLQDKPYPENEADDALIDRILYDYNMPVAANVVISNEKERYTAYSKLEQSCLEVMDKILTFYGSLPIGEDYKRDQFVAKLATDFIKVTHSAREELIKKYAVDKLADSESSSIPRIEIVDLTNSG